MSEVKQLEDVQEELKDWHPNTDHQVLDLVHSSLFCYVYGTTRALTTRPPESKMNASELFMSGEDQVLRSSKDSNYSGFRLNSKFPRRGKL